MDGSNVSPGVLYDRELNGYETPDSGLGDDGVSERFTHEQMDAAISVIKNEFLSWYGCELHSIAYASDEKSASEYRYYAGPESRKTGKNYADGIVFTSSSIRLRRMGRTRAPASIRTRNTQDTAGSCCKQRKDNGSL